MEIDEIISTMTPQGGTKSILKVTNKKELLK